MINYLTEPMIAISFQGFSITENSIPFTFHSNRIFQPFFTTKPTGSGTALGLSLSYDIVKAHNGELTFNSTPGTGSEFVISIGIA